MIYIGKTHHYHDLKGREGIDGLYAVSKESEVAFGEIFASIDRIWDRSAGK